MTGINHRHYCDYVRVQKETGLDVWLLFLHRNAETWPPDVQKWNAPGVCPTGLFTCRLMAEASHIAPDAKGVQMIYWPLSGLRLIAPLDEIAS